MSIALGICAPLTAAVWARRRRWPATPVAWPTLAWLVAFALAAWFGLDRDAAWRGSRRRSFPARAAGRDPRAGAAAGPQGAGRAARLRRPRRALRAGALGREGRRLARARPRRGRPLHDVRWATDALHQSRRGPARARARGALARRAAAAALAAGAALVATYTRSAWIGLAVALAVLLGLARPRRLWLLAGAIAIALALAPASYRERAWSSFDPHHPTNLERTCMWQGGIAMFRDHPLTGVGPQDLAEVYERYKPPGAGSGRGTCTACRSNSRPAWASSVGGLRAALRLAVRRRRARAATDARGGRARGRAARRRGGDAGGLPGRRALRIQPRRRGAALRALHAGGDGLGGAGLGRAGVAARGRGGPAPAARAAGGAR